MLTLLLYMYIYVCTCSVGASTYYFLNNCCQIQDYVTIADHFYNYILSGEWTNKSKEMINRKRERHFHILDWHMRTDMVKRDGEKGGNS